jgi:hypothetical protein
MPEVTRFYGIIIQIRFNREHNPPHFHAIYGEKEGAFDIKSLEMLYGDLPAKAQSLIKEWASQYQNELMQMWNTKQLQKLNPLD